MTFYNKLHDNELICLVKKGDDKAFAEVYKRYWGILYRHARRMIKLEEESQDVIQDIFESMWRNREVLEIKGTLSAYLYSSVRYKVFDLLDKGKVRNNYLEKLGDFVNKGVYTIDHLLIEKELAEQLEKEIGFLPKKMRNVFELSRKEHLNHKEIAEKLSLSDQTVKKQIQRALKILKPKFGIFIWYYIIVKLFL